MKFRALIAFFVIGSSAVVAAETAATPPPSASSTATPAVTAASPASETAATPPSPASADLEKLITAINAKLQQRKVTLADLAPDLAMFDTLVAKYKDGKDDEAARILYAEAMLYAQVLENTDKALEILQRLKKDFPSPDAITAADRMIQSIEAPIKAAKTQAAILGKPAPELHFKWSTREGLKTLSALKGKVVVLDFWATWCGPCVGSFPDVRELTAHYKDYDVVVLGVTSIQGAVIGLEAQPIDTEGNPTKEMALMTDYIKAKEITWTVAFSDEEVFNPDYGVAGIPYMAIIAPDGTVRHAGLDPRMPKEEKYPLIDALLKEAKKKLPPASEPR